MDSGWFFPGMVKLKSFTWIFFHSLWSKLVHFYGYQLKFLAVSRLTANHTRPLIKFDTFFLSHVTQVLSYLIRATFNTNCPKKKINRFSKQ